MTINVVFLYNELEEICCQELVLGDIYLNGFITMGTDATVTGEPSSSV